MTFKVRVKCLICRKLTNSTIILENETNVEALNLLHNKLCIALQLFSHEFQEWDFADEPFPYCESCCQRLQRLGELMDQLKRTEEEISGSLATVSALVITSDKSDDTSDIDPAVTPKLGQMKEYFRSRRLLEKHNYFRSLIIQRFDPQVSIERCDVCSYPGSSQEQYDFELLPKPLLLKTEPNTQELPDELPATEDSLFNQTEYKIESSTNLTSSVEPESSVEMEETWKSLAKAPALSLVSNQVENATSTAFTIAKDPGESIYSVQFEVTFDEASQTYEMEGLKFKELETGAFECCTCGHVSATHKGRGTQSKHNMIRHVKTVHTGIPKKTPVCTKVIAEAWSKRCDSYSYPGLADENYETELVPKNLVIKTEPAVEGLPGSADEESILDDMEYKVDTSTPDTSNVDPETIIGLEETCTSLTEASALRLALNQVENSATSIVTSAKDPVDRITKQLYCVKPKPNAVSPLWKKLLEFPYPETRGDEFREFMGLFPGLDRVVIGATTFYRLGLLRYRRKIILKNGILALGECSTRVNKLLETALCDGSRVFHVIPIIFETVYNKRDQKLHELLTKEFKDPEENTPRTRNVKFIRRLLPRHYGLMHVDNLTGSCVYLDLTNRIGTPRDLKDSRYGTWIRKNFPSYFRKKRRLGLPKFSVRFPAVGTSPICIANSSGFIMMWFWMELVEVAVGRLTGTKPLSEGAMKQWSALFPDSSFDKTLETLKHPDDRLLLAFAKHIHPEYFSSFTSYPKDFPQQNYPPARFIHGAQKDQVYERYALFSKRPRVREECSSASEEEEERVSEPKVVLKRSGPSLKRKRGIW